MRRLRAVIYARVSTAAQRERDTIASQLSTLPAFVERQGWELVGRPYVEDGISGAARLEERRELGRLLADAGAGVFDVVVVVALDRLSRSEDQLERAYVFGTLQRAGVAIAESSTGMVHHQGTFAGDVVLSLGALMAVEERRKLRERTMRGKDRAIAAGRKPSGPTPYGLRYERETGAFSIDQDEGARVLELYERVAGGESTARIALDWNVRGVPTGASDRRNKATEWRMERLYQLVTLTTYRGEWVIDKRRRLTLVVPPIVTEQLWYAAQDALKRWGRRGLRRTKHVYLAEDIARCATCGARVGISTHGYSTSTGYTRHGYYVCGHRRRPGFGMPKCDLPMRRVDEVDERLWVAVAQVFRSNFDELAGMVAERQARARAAAAGWEADAADYQGRIDRLDRTERALLERFRRGRVGEGALDHELEQLGRERAFLREQVDAARRAVAAGAASSGTAPDALAALRKLAARARPDQRRRIVRAIVPGLGPYVVTLGPHSVEALGGLWPESPLIAQGGGSSWRTVSECNIPQPLVELRLVG